MPLRERGEMYLQGEGGACLGSSSCDHACPGLDPQAPQFTLPSDVRDNPTTRISYFHSKTNRSDSPLQFSQNAKMSCVSYMAVFLSVQSPYWECLFLSMVVLQASGQPCFLAAFSVTCV